MSTIENVLSHSKILLWKATSRRTQIASPPANTHRQNPVLWKDMLFSATFSPHEVRCVEAQTGELQWKTQLGRLGQSNPVVDNRGFIYIATQQEIVCLEPASGSTKWRYCPYPEVQEAFYAIPTIDAARLYIGTTTGSIHCLEITNGNLVWQKKITPACQMVNSTALRLADNLVLGTNIRSAIGLNALSGTLLWKTRLDSNCSSQALHVGDFVVLHTDTAVYFVVPESGTVVYKWTRKHWRIKASTSYRDLLIIQVSRHPFCYEHARSKGIPENPSERVICLDQKSIKWESGLPDYSWGIRCHTREKLITVSAPGRILVYACDNGQYQYTLRVGSGDAGLPSIPSLRSGKLYAQSSRGTLYAFNLS